MAARAARPDRPPLRITFVCPSAREPIGGVTALYEFANGLARRGHDIHMIHLEMWGRSVEAMADLDRYRFEPAITHYLPGADPATLPDSDLVFGTGAPARLGLPVLLVQGIEMLHTHLERQAFRTPGLKVCVAGWLARAGERYGVPPEQVHLAPMGIDHDLFRPTTPIEARPPQVAMLHSTHVAKGWDVGRAALDVVHDHVPEVRATVFGTVAPPGELPDWIEFRRDPSPRELVDDVYSRSRVFLQPSWYEGFGFTAVEAMACGAALVTTDNGGSDDYAVPGETALLAGPGDVEGLAGHVVALLADDERRIALARAGQRFVSRFDWDLGAEVLEGHLFRYLDDPAAHQQPPGPELETAPDLLTAPPGPPR